MSIVISPLMLELHSLLCSSGNYSAKRVVTTFWQKFDSGDAEVFDIKRSVNDYIVGDVG